MPWSYIEGPVPSVEAHHRVNGPDRKKFWRKAGKKKNPTFYTFVHITVDIYGSSGIYSNLRKGHKKIKIVQWRQLPDKTIQIADLP